MIPELRQLLKKYWGYDSFLPLQEQAMESVGAGRDSLVVLPTGGGKSLCYQAPAVAVPGLAVVVSPLISLMKDQVDALSECGVPAARLDSTLAPAEKHAVRARIRNRTLKLLYVSPERLVSEGFIEFLKKARLSFIAVDEAHCVSMWGHDFRPEYRELGILRESFPGVAVHAYTATATEQVRRDIAVQLRLENPELLVGSFDRPNLVYKAERRANALNQICTVLDRHKNESGIIYCIRRVDVDNLRGQLGAKGYRALPYHAGMKDEDRKRNQEAFMQEKADIIVATVAFGMGIDKSNVRCVLHAAMPKSLEHYHQESGRGGRDGLEAECTVLYSGADYAIWSSILANTKFEPLESEADEIEPVPEPLPPELVAPTARQIALKKLGEMYSYCTGITCRHKAILNYFGQGLEGDNCGACDVCLGELETMEDALEPAQKIISCVLRLSERFGADYTASVLTGSREQRILDNRHDALSTYGLLGDQTKRVVRDWIEQLVGQDVLAKTGEFNVLTLTPKGTRVLRGRETPHLLKPPQKKPEKAKKRRLSKAAEDSWQDVDEGLFEELRELRRQLADKKRVPAYVVFGDRVLRDMARRRPATPQAFLQVHGVGEKKAEQYGDLFLTVIRRYCQAGSLKTDRS